MQKRTARKISARPLLTRLKDRGVSQTQFAKDNNYTPADVTNWKARGVPISELPKIAQWCRITVDAYLVEAGVLGASKPKSFDAANLLADYDALPDGLKEIVARKASELRKWAENLAPMFRETLKRMPTDPTEYKQRELEIEAAVAEMVKHDTPPPTVERRAVSHAPAVERRTVSHTPATNYRHKRSHQ